MSAEPRRRDERSLKMHPQDCTGSARVGRLGDRFCSRFGNLGGDRLDSRKRRGYRGWEPRRRALAREFRGKLAQRAGRGVHHVDTAPAVNLEIDKPRHDVVDSHRRRRPASTDSIVSPKLTTPATVEPSARAIKPRNRFIVPGPWRLSSR